MAISTGNNYCKEEHILEHRFLMDLFLVKRWKTEIFRMLHL